MPTGSKRERDTSMSETTDTAPAGEQNTEGQHTDFEPITSQEVLDKIVQSRLARERAKYQDYDELKAKAEKFDSTEAELSALKADKQLDEWKQQVSKDAGVPADALRGTTLEELTAHGEVLKSLLKSRPTAPVVPDVGKQPEAKSDPTRDFVRELFGKN